MSSSSLVLSIKMELGREGGTGKWERAAKGDGKGKTNGCLTTKRRTTHCHMHAGVIYHE